ncbi:ABC-type transport auxiliary lipoprotein family protein [Thiocystis violacea]|uniref:ABC-type transport auxiliary lipoprotein family protein n=1 Tax=Thiocystis violacea TaxID=13725 RepID=UPI001907544E|nr:ABC-type transport auxiliary lipoprotein family protein [Thiocystis violacea]MBK1718877.1 hypothetical protein [Thiocystis violacea]
MSRSPFKRDPRPFLALSLLLSLMLGGCGTAPPVPRDRYYTLDPDFQTSAGGPPLAASLLVNDLAARGFLGGRQILYRTQERPLAVDRYQVYLWDEPLPRAMASVLARAIREAGLFTQVIIPADRARADFLLGGELIRFEHRPTDRPPVVAATLSLSLVKADDRRSLWTRQYSATEPLAANRPDAMAEAFNRLAARLAAEVLSDLRTSRPLLQTPAQSGAGT